MSDCTIGSMNQLPLHHWKKLCRILRMVWWLMFISFDAGAQQPIFRQYTIRDGLPSNVVYSAVQDDQGFMWFGTDAGVVRFDGKRFEPFSVNDGLPDNDILRLFKDSKGRIWFLSLNGKLSYYHNGQIHNANNDRLVPNFTSIGGFLYGLEDNTGNLYFGGLANNILYLNKNGKSLQMINDEFSLNIGLGYHINLCTSSTGKIIANYRHKIYTYELPSFNRVEIPLTFSFDSTYCFSNGPNNSIVVIADNRINVIINDKISIQYPITDYIMDHSTRMSLEPDGSVWLHNSYAQTKYYKRVKNTFIDGVTYLKGKHVSQIYVDSEGNRWICTNGFGLFQTLKNESFFKNIQPNKSDESNEIFSLIKDSLGGLIFTDRKGIIYRKLGNEIQLLKLNKNDDLVNRVLDMLLFNGDEIICASDVGLFMVKLTKDGLKNPVFILDERQKSPVSFKSIASSNNAIFVSNRNVIMRVKRNPITKKYTIKETVYKSGRTYAMQFDFSQNLWFEQFERLNCLSNDSLISFPQYDSLFIGKITDIKFIDNDKMIVATYGKGIRVFEEGKLKKTINKKSGLCSEYCNKLFIKGKEWFVATSQGISVIHWQTDTSSKITSYYKNDGLLSDKVNDIVADDERIYMATSLGLCILDRKIDISTSKPPLISIKSLTVNGVTKEFLGDVIIPSNARSIKIAYVAPTFVAPDKIAYQYRISLQAAWQSTELDELEFTSIPPGTYIFQVRARVYNSSWSKPVTVHFQVIPLFYETLGFKILLGGFLVIIVYLSLRQLTSRKLRHQLRQLEQQRMIETERRRISADVHDDFGADLTQIVLLSRLAKKRPEEQEIIDRIEASSLGVITKMNEIIWALNPTNDTVPHLVSYLRRLANEFSDTNGISIDFYTLGEMPDIMLSAVFRRNLFLIFKESLRNIIKHAEAKKVEVRVEYDSSASTIRMSIKDDGNGFNESAKAEYGNGLQNMKKRAEEINAKLSVIKTTGGGTEIQLMVTLPK